MNTDIINDLQRQIDELKGQVAALLAPPVDDDVTDTDTDTVEDLFGNQED
jgi:hypothetical protein